MDAQTIITELQNKVNARTKAQAEYSAALAVARAFQKGKLFTPEQHAQVEKLAPTHKREKKPAAAAK